MCYLGISGIFALFGDRLGLGDGLRREGHLVDGVVVGGGIRHDALDVLRGQPAAARAARICLDRLPPVGVFADQCALNLGKPCPTYRPADRGLRPERQLAFVFRSERSRAVYAFPQPQ